jgi:chromosome segregation ATPase
MGIIWDLVKEIPLSGVLKEKITDLDAKVAGMETEITLLNGQLTRAKNTIQQLTDENRELRTQAGSAATTDLNVTERRILDLFSRSDPETVSSESISTILSEIRPMEIELYIHELEKRGMLMIAGHRINGGPSYQLTDVGRRWIIMNMP